MNLTDIERLTLEYGQAWAHPHALRLLKLVEEIGAGLEYDREVIAYTAYLHD